MTSGCPIWSHGSPAKLVAKGGADVRPDFDWEEAAPTRDGFRTTGVAFSPKSMLYLSHVSD
jgi:hypothetical protein